MTVRLLHVSDSLVADGDVDAEAGSRPIGGIDLVVERAKSHDVDAVVHTGNLFRRPSPRAAAIDSVADHLEELPVPCFVVSGDRETAGEGDPLSVLADRGLVQRLGPDPTVVDDEVVLYGIDHVGGEELADELGELTEDDGHRCNLCCLHQDVWPAKYHGETDVKAFEILNHVDPYLNAVLAGGLERPKSWSDDDTGYHVVYPGSSNPAAHDPDGVGPSGTLVTVDGPDEVEFRDVPLSVVTARSEIDRLRSFLDEDPGTLEDADVETLTDLYGLLSKGKSRLDDRRKTVRDEFLERTDPDSVVEGQYATVSHDTSTRTSMRDEEEVLRALDRVGVSRDQVTTESIDRSKLREVVDDTDLDETEVFETSEHTTARRRSVDLAE